MAFNPLAADHPTAQEVVAGQNVEGKTFVITGACAGLGREAARVLASAGARVVGTHRSLTAPRELDAYFREGYPKGEVVLERLELTDLASVRAFADRVHREGRIDSLILNAGEFAAPRTYTKHGWELHMGTNYLAHFYLTQLLAPKLIAQAFPSRIVALSSSLHNIGEIHLGDLHYRRRLYSGIKAYGDSKLAVVHFVRDFFRRHQDSHVSAFAVHPGVIPTKAYRHFGALMPILNTGLSLLPRWLDAKSHQEGAATIVYGATAPELEHHSGAYLADCRIQQPADKALDLTMSANLWDRTEEEIRTALQQEGLNISA